MNYFDTGALIKRFVAEPGSKHVDAVLAGEPIVATSKVAYAESTRNQGGRELHRIVSEQRVTLAERRCLTNDGIAHLNNRVSCLVLIECSSQRADIRRGKQTLAPSASKSGAHLRLADAHVMRPSAATTSL